MRPRCYVASPLGFTEAGRRYLRDLYLPALRAVVEPVDPWALTTPDEVRAAAREGRERELWLTVGERNLDAIRGADLLCAYLEGQELDSGTVVEVGYAAGLGKPCFGLRTDARRAGEPGMAVNLQVEATIVGSGGAIARSLGELVGALEAHAARAA